MGGTMIGHMGHPGGYAHGGKPVQGVGHPAGCGGTGRKGKGKNFNSKGKGKGKPGQPALPTSPSRSTNPAAGTLLPGSPRQAPDQEVIECSNGSVWRRCKVETQSGSGCTLSYPSGINLVGCPGVPLNLRFVSTTTKDPLAAG